MLRRKKDPFLPLLPRVSPARGSRVSVVGGVWCTDIVIVFMEWGGNPSLPAGQLLSGSWVPWVGGRAGLCLPAMLWIFTVLWAQLDTGQSPPRQSCHPLAEGQMVGRGRWTWWGITSNPVLEGAEGFAAYFMKVSAVCRCGEVNLCVVLLQQCRRAHWGSGAPSRHPHAAASVLGSLGSS